MMSLRLGIFEMTPGQGIMILVGLVPLVRRFDYYVLWTIQAVERVLGLFSATV